MGEVEKTGGNFMIAPEVLSTLMAAGVRLSAEGATLRAGSERH